MWPAARLPGPPSAAAGWSRRRSLRSRHRRQFAPERFDLAIALFELRAIGGAALFQIVDTPAQLISLRALALQFRPRVVQLPLQGAGSRRGLAAGLRGHARHRQPQRREKANDVSRSVLHPLTIDNSGSA